MLVTSVVQLESLYFHAVQAHLVRPRVGRQVLGHLVALAFVADQLHRAVNPDLGRVKVGPIILLEILSSNQINEKLKSKLQIFFKESSVI